MFINIRLLIIIKVKTYQKSLPATLSEEGKHKKLLKYMAEEGIRQFDTALIGDYAERQRPEPMHCEINAWQNVLNVIYLEYVERGMFPRLTEVISAHTSGNSPVLGCGLGYLVTKMKEHYSFESTRHNKLPIRLIGEQAIALANYSYRLVDGLVVIHESQPQRLRRFALGKLVEYLRNVGVLINKIAVCPDYIVQLKERYSFF